MLSSIAKLLDERGVLSVQEIGLVLGIESSALHPMLDLLERKGRIKKLALACGKSCSSCPSRCSDPDAMTYYKPVV